MSNVKIRGLPDGPYQVKCPDPIPEEWDELCEAASGDYGGGSENYYYKIDSGGYEYSLKKWPDIPVIEYNHWKKCIEDHIKDVPVTTEEAYQKPTAMKRVQDLTEKEVIHCPTEEEAVAICKLMHEAGMTWWSGGSYIDWNGYKEETCYYPKDGTYCCKKYFEQDDYTIYPASMFLQQEPVMVTVENAYVGMRVIRGRDWYSMNSKQVMDAQDSNGTVSGTIVDVHGYKENYVTVNWDNGREGVVYRIGAEDKYDLYQCNKQVTTNNQTLTNNQKQTNNATYKRNTEQEICNKQQYTGNIICEEDKENSCTIISSRYYKGTAAVYAPIECIIRGQRAIGVATPYRG